MDLTLHFLVPAERSLFERVESAVAGGVTVVQLRDKERDDRTRFEVGRELRALCRQLGVAFLVNDRVDLALALKADGVHLGQGDLPVEVALQLIPKAMVVGLSTHRLAEVEAARQALYRPDYLAFGPIFATRSKADAEPATGVALLAEAVRAADPLPVVAIGGIDRANKDQVFAAGAAGVAVISALLTAEEVEEAARALLPTGTAR